MASLIFSVSSPALLRSSARLVLIPLSAAGLSFPPGSPSGGWPSRCSGSDSSVPHSLCDSNDN